MKRTQKEVLILIVLILLMLLAFGYRFYYRSIDRQQFEALKISMSMEEVKALLGEPVRITKYHCPIHGPSEVWRYNIKYSLLGVSLWFRPSEDGEMRLFDKNWGLGG